MGRRLSVEGHLAVMDSITLRLVAVLREATKAPPTDVSTLTALLGSILTPAGDASAPDTAASLERAACDLLAVRAPPASMESQAGWITRYFAPSSRHRLPGAAALWTRAVNLERDRKRRAKIEPVKGCPIRLTLSTRHRELVAEQLDGKSHQSASAIVGKLIEREHDRRSRKKQQPAVSQPLLNLKFTRTE